VYIPHLQLEHHDFDVSHTEMFLLATYTDRIEDISRMINSRCVEIFEHKVESSPTMSWLC